MAHGEASGKLPVLARDKKKPEIESIPHRELWPTDLERF